MSTESTPTEIQESLERPFTQEALRVNEARGLTYIPVSEVIARLNAVLGLNWEFRVRSNEVSTDVPGWVVCHGTLTLHLPDGRSVSRDGFGGQAIKTKRSGDVVDLGDEFKGASSDALKKAAQSFGIALDLARTEEAVWAESLAARPDPDPALVLKVRELLESSPAELRKEAKQWWKQRFHGSIETALDSEIEDLLNFLQRPNLKVPVATPVEADEPPGLVDEINDVLDTLDPPAFERAKGHWKKTYGAKKLRAGTVEEQEEFLAFIRLLGLGGEVE